MAFDPITSGQAVVTGPAKAFDPLVSGQAVAHFDPVASGQAVPDTETSTAGAETPPDEVRAAMSPAPDPSLLEKFFGGRQAPMDWEAPNVPPKIPTRGITATEMAARRTTDYSPPPFGTKEYNPLLALGDTGKNESFLNLPEKWPGLPPGAVKQALGNLGPTPEWMKYVDPRELAKVVYDGLAPTAKMLAHRSLR